MRICSVASGPLISGMFESIRMATGMAAALESDLSLDFFDASSSRSELDCLFITATRETADTASRPLHACATNRRTVGHELTKARELC